MSALWRTSDFNIVTCRLANSTVLSSFQFHLRGRTLLGPSIVALPFEGPFREWKVDVLLLVLPCYIIERFPFGISLGADLARAEHPYQVRHEDAAFEEDAEDI